MIKLQLQTITRLDGIISVYDPSYKEVSFVVSRSRLGWSLTLSTQKTPDFYKSLEEVMFALAAHEEGLSL